MIPDKKISAASLQGWRQLYIGKSYNAFAEKNAGIRQF
jgi:hypothetical protein